MKAEHGIKHYLLAYYHFVSASQGGSYLSIHVMIQSCRIIIPMDV